MKGGSDWRQGASSPSERQAGVLPFTSMNKLLILIGMTLFSWLGWWAGEPFGFLTGFLLSGLGSLIGVYVGWRINRDYFD